MAQSREVMYLEDFRGGLNLTAQQQNLGPKESPDVLNIDFGVAGGITSRGGFRSQGTDQNLDDARFLGATYFSDDVVIILGDGGDMYEWDGSTLDKTPNSATRTLTDDMTRNVRMAAFGGKAYFANCLSSSTLIMRGWDGTTLDDLSTGWSFNDDYTTPTTIGSGYVVPARHIAHHNTHMWVADTVESGGRYSSRLRWSHLGQPEDWATNDYVDIDDFDEGDPITALVPFRDMLLVFKRSSVHAIFGYNRTEFFREQIAPVSGVNDPRAVATNAGVCYWFSGDGTIMAFNGRQVAPLTQNLKWWVQTGKIKAGGDHVLAWSDGRLWISAEAGSAEIADRYLFVWDADIKALTRYDLQPSDIFHWERLDQEHDPLFLVGAPDINIWRYDRAYEADLYDGTILLEDGTALLLEDGTYAELEAAVTQRIDAYYRTAWQTAGETATKKRWKRPRVTAAATGDATIQIDVYHDFNSNETKKTSSFPISGDENAQWGSAVWGVDVWSTGADDVYEFSREPSGGSARAIQYKICSPDNAARWWVDSIAVPFRRKQVK